MDKYEHIPPGSQLQAFGIGIVGSLLWGKKVSKSALENPAILTNNLMAQIAGLREKIIEYPLEPNWVTHYEETAEKLRLILGLGLRLG
jgi:hypothetical protein